MKTKIYLIHLFFSSIIGIFLIINSCKKEKINQLPTVLITNPESGTSFSHGSIINLNVEAEDADGNIIEVKFYIDNIEKEHITISPYIFKWNSINESVGTHKIIISAKDNDGGIKSDSITITLMPNNSTADFIANKTDVSTGTYINFIDQSTNNPTSWNWDFGDGNYSTLQNPSHIYTLSGKYSVSLIVKNMYNSDTIVKPNYITVGSIPTPKFNATPTIIEVGKDISFEDQSTENPNIWNWDFGDGDTSKIQNPTHRYANVGFYSVSLKVENYYGSDSIIKYNYIRVGVVPEAKYNSNKTTITTGENIDFYDQSTNNPTSWLWKFGDGSTSTIQNPSHIYNTSGLYTVSLTSTNEFGSNTIEKTKYIIVSLPNTVMDIDGNTYKTIKISDQTWMAENLRVSKYNDGTTIPNVTNNTDWANLTTGAWCNYNNNFSYNSTYGKLYNWYTVNTGKLCPSGWHVPKDSEWTFLANYLGGESIAGGKLKEIGTTHWKSPNTGATDDFGFSALPGGQRNDDGGGFGGSFNYAGYWWSSTEQETGVGAYYLWLNYNSTYLSRTGWFKACGYSVRCLKD